VFTALTPRGGLFQHLCLGRRDPRSSPRRSCARDAGETVRGGGQRCEDHCSALLNHWQLFIARRARHSGEPLKPWADEQKNCPYDEVPLALMRANPWARVTEIIRMNGRPRNSTVSSLKRVEKAGLVAHAGRGKWTVVDPDSLKARCRNRRDGSSRSRASA
jgi:hypothetical protein